MLWSGEFAIRGALEFECSNLQLWEMNSVINAVHMLVIADAVLVVLVIRAHNTKLTSITLALNKWPDQISPALT
jgi:hypothetical protein